MTRYNVDILAAGGSLYAVNTADPKVALAFLRKHDHDGALVSIRWWNNFYHKRVEGETVYRVLEEAVEAEVPYEQL